jgi:hypothetical protein
VTAQVSNGIQNFTGRGEKHVSTLSTCQAAKLGEELCRGFSCNIRVEALAVWKPELKGTPRLPPRQKMTRLRLELRAFCGVITPSGGLVKQML